MGVTRIDFSSISTIFLKEFGTDLTSVGFFCFLLSEGERSCICMLRVSLSLVFTIFL